MTDLAPERAAPLIVHVIYELGTGGLENGLVNIINRMPSERYRHAIVCLTTAGSFASRLSKPDVEIIELRKPPGNSVRILLQLYTVLRKMKPAIVHTRNLAALETQILGLLMPGTRRVHGEHGRDVSDIDGSNARYQLLRRLLSPLISRFICVSEDLAVWLRDEVRISQAKVRQIYNGVDEQMFNAADEAATLLSQSLDKDKERIVLGTVGRLVEVKDQATLICAIEHILKLRPELRERLQVMIVGAGPLREALESQAASVGDFFCFTGETDKVREHLREMDVFVLPSLGEGISNTILEAMSCARPVIASHVGGNPELVLDGVTGLLFPVRDSRSLAEALLVLIDDPAQRLRLGQAGLQLVTSRHNWNQTVKAYLRVYDEVLGISTDSGKGQNSSEGAE